MKLGGSSMEAATSSLLTLVELLLVLLLTLVELLPLTLVGLLFAPLVELLFTPRVPLLALGFNCVRSSDSELVEPCLDSCWFRCSLLRLLLRLLTVPASSLVGTPVEFASLSS